MRKITYLSLIIVYGIFITLLSFRFVRAFFTDSANSNENTFTAAAEFPTPTSGEEPPPIATSSGIVINEVFPGGALTVEWVELFNPTGSPIDVSGWDIVDNSTFDILPATPPIPPGGYAVIIASPSAVSVPGSAITIQLNAATIGNGLNNETDRVILRDISDVQIDAMSFGGNTTVFASPPASPSASQSVARIPNGNDTDNALDWSIDDTPTLGTANSL